MPRFARIMTAAALGLALSAAAAMADSPPSALDRGHGQQTWQNPGYASLVAACKTPPKPFGIPISRMTEPPRLDFPPPSAVIPGVIAAGQSWKTVWAWKGNNVDGPIAAPGGAIVVGNNDAGNVMRIDPATGLGRVLYKANTAGAVSRSKNGALFVAERGLPELIVRLEPSRKLLARSFDGQPLECVGGVINDLSADAKGGAYIAISGGGLFYADPRGKVSEYGQNVGQANGIILSPDEKTLYVGSGLDVYAFDVQADGSLTGQRAFAQLHTGRVADGSAVDSTGGSMSPPVRRSTSSRPRDTTSAPSPARRASTAWPSAARTSAPSTASSSTAAGARPPPATSSSPSRCRPKAISGGRSRRSEASTCLSALTRPASWLRADRLLWCAQRLGLAPGQRSRLSIGNDGDSRQASPKGQISPEARAGPGRLVIDLASPNPNGKSKGHRATLQFGSVSLEVKVALAEERARNVELGQTALKKMKRKLVTPGVRLRTPKNVPLFFADPTNPRRVIREIDGRREAGVFENGTFKALK